MGAFGKEGVYNERLRNGTAKVTHGKYSTYRAYGCRCEPCREAHMIFRRKRHYGLTDADFLTMLVLQDCKCAVCEKEFPKFDSSVRFPVHVDHNHESNEVRGLLCVRCNSGMGKFEDDPELLTKAVKYLGGE